MARISGTMSVWVRAMMAPMMACGSCEPMARTSISSSQRSGTMFRARPPWATLVRAVV